MEAFDPLVHVDGAEKLTGENGAWPNFHDAEIRHIVLDAGDMRPDDDVWIGPSIEIQFDLQAFEVPFKTTLRFEDCEQIELAGFNHSNDIYELEFSFENRGTYTNGAPLPPYIRVKVVSGFGVALTFVCFRVKVVS